MDIEMGVQEVNPNLEQATASVGMPHQKMTGQDGTLNENSPTETQAHKQSYAEFVKSIGRDFLKFRPLMDYMSDKQLELPHGSLTVHVLDFNRESKLSDME
ncbi:hypothetical protein G7Y89_g5250 [Cudoniella acicularis]|uniref:Uncharacterized protein n=1 Tax=Cudoniella acicularis TaxID=354080 RepID=A0A8H4RR00_9HELO|nr:hypothetical protein G7Y89_g5250 [Cudoniella acicularis]